jgi:hypothetical protein
MVAGERPSRKRRAYAACIEINAVLSLGMITV